MRLERGLEDWQTTCSGCIYNCTKAGFHPPEFFPRSPTEGFSMNFPIRRVSRSIIPYRNLEKEQASALNARLLPRSPRGSLTPLATSLLAPSVEHSPGPLCENPLETLKAFAVDFLSFRSTFTYPPPHLRERLLAAYSRAEQLGSTGKDRILPIIDIYV